MSEERQPPLSSVPPAGAPKVVVVEDNADGRLVLEYALRSHCRLRSFADAPSALTSMIADPPDVAVLDISLPGMSGLELLAAMREQAALCDVPTIALTAHSMRGDAERLLAAGFDDYIGKPVSDFNALVTRILDYAVPHRSGRQERPA